MQRLLLGQSRKEGIDNECPWSVDRKRLRVFGYFIIGVSIRTTIIEIRENKFSASPTQNIYRNNVNCQAPVSLPCDDFCQSEGLTPSDLPGLKRGRG